MLTHTVKARQREMWEQREWRRRRKRRSRPDTGVWLSPEARMERNFYFSLFLSLFLSLSPWHVLYVHVSLIFPVSFSSLSLFLSLYPSLLAFQGREFAAPGERRSEKREREEKPMLRSPVAYEWCPGLFFFDKQGHFCLSLQSDSTDWRETQLNFDLKNRFWRSMDMKQISAASLSLSRFTRTCAQLLHSRVNGYRLLFGRALVPFSFSDVFFSFLSFFSLTVFSLYSTISHTTLCLRERESSKCSFVYEQLLFSPPQEYLQQSIDREREWAAAALGALASDPGAMKRRVCHSRLASWFAHHQGACESHVHPNGLAFVSWVAAEREKEEERACKSWFMPGVKSISEILALFLHPAYIQMVYAITAVTLDPFSSSASSFSFVVVLVSCAVVTFVLCSLDAISLSSLFFFLSHSLASSISCVHLHRLLSVLPLTLSLTCVPCINFCCYAKVQKWTEFAVTAVNTEQ